MLKNKFNQIVDKMLDSDFIDGTEQLTTEEIQFLKENPRLLNKISDTSFIKIKYIYRLFALGASAAIIAKVIEYTKILEAFEIVNNLLTEVLFSISMEIIGATIIAYFLEITLQKRVEKNQKIVSQIMKTIKK